MEQTCGLFKKEVKKRLDAITLLKNIASFKTKKNDIVRGLFQSVLSYCLPLFGGCEKNKLKELQILQNSAARIVCNAHWRIPGSTLFDKVGLMSIPSK